MIDVTMTETNGPAQVAASMPEVVAQAATAVLQMWHSEMMPTHFTVEGFSKYGYQLRKGQDEPPYVQSNKGIVLAGGQTKYGQNRVTQNPKYYWDKWRRKGTHDPLVYTGKSLQMAKQQVRLSTRYIKSRDEIKATAAFSLPRYFYQYRTDLNAPDKANEMTRTTPDERDRLQERLREAVQAGLASLNPAASSRVIQ